MVVAHQRPPSSAAAHFGTDGLGEHDSFSGSSNGPRAISPSQVQLRFSSASTKKSPGAAWSALGPNMAPARKPNGASTSGVSTVPGGRGRGRRIVLQAENNPHLTAQSRDSFMWTKKKNFFSVRDQLFSSKSWLWQLLI